MQSKSAGKYSRGFTLVEILIVVAILAILTAVSIPALSSRLERTRAAVCEANMRSLLAVVRIQALTEDVVEADAFTSLYSAQRDDYPCPEDGVFSWQDGQIVCGKHSGGGAAAVSVSAGYPSVVLSPDIDDTVRAEEDKMKIELGKIYKTGNNYFVGLDNYSLQTINDDYASWLASSYYVKKVDFSLVYTKAELDDEGVIKDYGDIVGKTRIGSIYEYDGRLYVQTKSFTAKIKNQSSDPSITTEYWTPLGTIQ